MPPHKGHRTTYYVQDGSSYPAIVTTVIDSSHVDVCYIDGESEYPILVENASWHDNAAYGTADPPPEPPGGGN